MQLRVRAGEFLTVHERPPLTSYVYTALLITFMVAGTLYFLGDSVSIAIYLPFTLSFVLLILSSSVDGGVSNRRVTILRAHPSLYFAPSIWSNVTWLASSLCAVVSCIGMVRSWVLPHTSPFGSASGLANPVLVMLFMLGSVVFFVTWATVRMFRRTGLRIDSSGILWRTVFTQHAAAWTDLDDIGVSPRRNGGSLTIRMKDGNTARLYSITLGTNPLIVAAAIEYFRTHPEERHKTGDPMVALQAFAEVER